MKNENFTFKSRTETLEVHCIGRFPSIYIPRGSCTGDFCPQKQHPQYRSMRQRCQIFIARAKLTDKYTERGYSITMCILLYVHFVHHLNYLYKQTCNYGKYFRRYCFSASPSSDAPCKWIVW